MEMRRNFTLRVESVLLDKLHHAAKRNKRSVNNQIEMLIQDFIDDFEKANGPIQLTNTSSNATEQ